MLMLRAVMLQSLHLTMRRPAPVVVLLVVGVVVEARPNPPTRNELGKRQCWRPRKVLTIRCDGKVLTVTGIEGQRSPGVGAGNFQMLRPAPTIEHQRNSSAAPAPTIERQGNSSATASDG